MNQLKNLSTEQPFIFVLLLVSVSIATLYSHQLISFDDIFMKDLSSSVIKNIITVLLLVMTIRLNFLDKTQLNTGYKHWHTKWWLATIPMALIALLNTSSIAWNTLEFAPLKVIGWLYINASTGVFEEVLLRGVCFAVLYNAWKNKDNGLIKAALCQALIFGVAHYVNLTKAPFIEVTIQVMYSTLIGIGFAGLVAFSRSLWPAIVLHTLINSVGTISEYFQPNYVAGELSLINYAVVITIIAIICALPGYFLLKRAQLALPNHNLATG